MPVGGLLLLLPTLALAGYGLFALGSDGGSDRVWGDLMLLAAAAIMGFGAIAMIRGRTWGAYVGVGVLALLLALVTAAALQA